MSKSSSKKGSLTIDVSAITGRPAPQVKAAGISLSPIEQEIERINAILVDLTHERGNLETRLNPVLVGFNHGAEDGKEDADYVCSLHASLRSIGDKLYTELDALRTIRNALAI